MTRSLVTSVLDASSMPGGPAKDRTSFLSDSVMLNQSRANFDSGTVSSPGWHSAVIVSVDNGVIVGNGCLDVTYTSMILGIGVLQTETANLT